MPTRPRPVFSITLQQRRRLAAKAALLASAMIPLGPVLSPTAVTG